VRRVRPPSPPCEFGAHGALHSSLNGPIGSRMPNPRRIVPEHEHEYGGPFFLGGDRFGYHRVAVDRRIRGFRIRLAWRRWRETNARAVFRGDAPPAIAEEETDGEESPGIVGSSGRRARRPSVSNLPVGRGSRNESALLHRKQAVWYCLGDLRFTLNTSAKLTRWAPPRQGAGRRGGGRRTGDLLPASAG
jgi:hypothetical protein